MPVGTDRLDQAGKIGESFHRDTTEPAALCPLDLKMSASRFSPSLLTPVAVALVLATWLTNIAGPGTSEAFARMVVLLALATVSWACGRALLSHYRESGGGWQGLLLPGLLGVALIIRFNGLGWEAGEGNYRDEGIYLATARRIHAGQTLQYSFIYGHLLFYLTAFAIWLQELFPTISAWIAAKLGGAAGSEQQTWVIVRSINALFGALTTLPVYGAARRLGGQAAAIAAALLILCSPLYDEISKLLISDLPSAFFASLCLYFVARLLGEETPRDYLLAGISAGLAAGSKYPAGLVAIAIVSVWLRHRINDRRWNWGLVIAGSAALSSFVVSVPGIVAAGSEAFTGGGRDIFFGVRQYGGGGWIGVMRDSNAAFYGRVSAESFLWPAVLFGTSGLLFLPTKRRRDLLWFLVFPIAYAGLIIAMSMAVKRNLLPILPALAVVFGVGLAAWRRPFDRWPVWGPRLASALVVVAAALPMIKTLENQFALTQPGTRELALDWIAANAPPGARFVQESYTPKIDSERWQSSQGRFAGRRSVQEVSAPDNDFLLLAWNAYGRFTKPENLSRPHHQTMADRYAAMLAWERLADLRAGRVRRGPWLSIFKVPLDPSVLISERDWQAKDADFLYQVDRRPRRLVWNNDGWALFKAPLRAGDYRVGISPPPTAGALRIVDIDNREVAALRLADAPIEFTWPENGKAFVYLELPAGQHVEHLRIERR